MNVGLGTSPLDKGQMQVVGYYFFFDLIGIPADEVDFYSGLAGSESGQEFG